MKHQLGVSDTEHAFALRRGLDAMREKRQSCDLVIKVGKEEMAVHRNVLMAQSEYFNAMFTHDTLENKTGVVEMKDVRFEPVKKCVDYFYTGKISTSEEGCEDVLYTSSLMQVKPVCDEIAPFLESRLNPKSFFNIRKIAIKFDLENLKKVCVEFALENLAEIVKKEEFNQLEIEYISQLITSKTCFHTGGEDSKMAIVLQWIKADVENRSKHLVSMLGLLDLKKTTLAYTGYLVESDTLVSKSSEVMAMLFRAEMDRQNVKPAAAKILSLSSSVPNAILMLDVTSKSLQTYRPSTKTWTRLQPLQESMLKSDGCTAVVVDQLLYVLMGDKKGYKINFSDANSKWIQLPDMLFQHKYFITATSSAEFIYVSGQDQLEKYSLNENKWEKITISGICCDRNTLLHYKGAFLSIGGVDNGSCKTVNTVESISSPISVAPMQVARHVTSVCVHGDTIYVAGGYDYDHSLSDVEGYNSETNTWEKMPSLLKPRCYSSLVTIGNSLYAVGNYKETFTIEKFDLEPQQWKMELEKPEMKVKSAACVAISLPE